MEEKGETPPALASRPVLDSSLALLYGDYKNIRCSRQSTMAGYGRVPYSELALYAAVQGYRNSELREFVEELQWVDTIFNEVEFEFISEKNKSKTNNDQPVRPPNAKEQNEQREQRRNRLRPPINGLKK